MKLLALDCSTEACSVAVTNDGIVTEKFELATREHTQKLLPMIDSVLGQSGVSLQQLDAIAFGRGPGSFTGLRICLGAVQGLAFGAQLPVVPISSLAAVAQTAVDEKLVAESSLLLSTLDARMDEIYWGLFGVEMGLVKAINGEHLTSPEKLVLQNSQEDVVSAIGSGCLYGDRIACYDETSTFDGSVLPKASAVLKLAIPRYQAGDFLRADEAIPTYLRDQVAWKKQGQV